MANNMDTSIYTLKWFLQCFLERIPFSLTIRVWDLYLLEGESIMIAMAYSILKLHYHTLLKMGMDEMMEFVQKTLPMDFGFDNDFVIETALYESLLELKSSQLHTAGPPPKSEKPQHRFGLLKDIASEDSEMRVGERLPATENSDASSDLFLTETGSLEDDLDKSWKSDTATTTSETEISSQAISESRDQVTKMHINEVSKHSFYF